ncbi:MAG: hypothetical protein WB930_20035 [Syntrophobacteraceae bacterium]
MSRPEKVDIGRTVAALAADMLHEWRNRNGPLGLVPLLRHNCQRAKKAGVIKLLWLRKQTTLAMIAAVCHLMEGNKK